MEPPFQSRIPSGLRQITRALAGVEDLDTSLDLIVRQTTDLMEVDSCSLYLLDPDEETLRLRASTGLSEEALGRGTLLIGEGMTGQAVAQGQPLFAPQAKRNPFFKRVLGAREMVYESLLAAPLIIEEKVIGAINVQTLKEHHFQAGEVDLLSLIGDLAAGTLYKAQLYEQQRQQLEELQALARLSEAVTAPQYLDDMLDVVTGMAAQTMGVQVVSIFLIDESDEYLELRATEHSDIDYHHRPPAPRGAGIIGIVAEVGQEVYIKNVQEDDRYRNRGLAREEGLVSMLAVPLQVRDRVIGVMACYTSEETVFTTQQRSLFLTLANQTALAIENAQLVTNAAVVREMHHRIKNNLQTVAMLMRLQMGEADRVNSRQILEVSIGRVQSIAAVHETLSERGFHLVEVLDVIKRVVGASLLPPNKEIELSVSGAAFALPSRAATALSLVVNELVQNSIEHGFEGREKGRIEVVLARTTEKFLVTVRDNGRGIPESPNQNLGLELVHTLVENDLKGKIDFFRLYPGTEFSIQMPRTIANSRE